MEETAPEPNLELLAELRNQVFEELEGQADRAASYARSIAEAAFRGDETTVEVHLRQLRACVLTMIQTFKEMPQGGQGVAEKGVAGPDREDQRTGDGVAGGEPQ